MKIYTNKHGTKYTYKKKYIIRSISSDGVIKLCSEINARQWTRSEYEWFDTEEEALECLAKNEIHDGVVLTQIDIDYNP